MLLVNKDMIKKRASRVWGIYPLGYIPAGIWGGILVSEPRTNGLGGFIVAHVQAAFHVVAEPAYLAAGLSFGLGAGLSCLASVAGAELDRAGHGGSPGLI